MLDHIGIEVCDFARSHQFFRKTLQPLGYGLIAEFSERAGFGIAGKPDFRIRGAGASGSFVHIASRSANREVVEAFDRAALEVRVRKNGAPGLSQRDHPHCFGVFVRVPDGHDIEAVCHDPA